jgi:flagellar biosynthesis protein FlhB
MINVLKALSLLVFTYMIYIVVSTSYQSNLFDLMANWDSVNVMSPWFKATLWDFYANVFFIFIWITYKENSVVRSFIWLVLLITMGSIATAAYMIIQLFKLKPGEGLKKVFSR